MKPSTSPMTTVAALLRGRRRPADARSRAASSGRNSARNSVADAASMSAPATAPSRYGSKSSP